MLLALRKIADTELPIPIRSASIAGPSSPATSGRRTAARIR